MRRRIAALSTIALLGALLVAPSPGSAAAVNCAAIVGHRGAPTLAPENTVPGITAAGAAGADGVEVDVRLSKSEYPLLMHDETVDRTTPGTGRVDALWLGQLTSLWAADYAPWSTDPAYADTLVPYIYDVVLAASTAGVDLVIDHKAPPAQIGMGKIAQHVTGHGWTDRTLVMASEANLPTMRSMQPGLRYVLIEYNPRSDGITQQIRTGEALQALGVVGYAVPARDITPAAVTYWRSYGMQVLTWTTDNGWDDTDAEWDRVADAGVTHLITNDPAGAADWATVRGC